MNDKNMHHAEIIKNLIKALDKSNFNYVCDDEYYFIKICNKIIIIDDSSSTTTYFIFDSELNPLFIFIDGFIYGPYITLQSKLTNDDIKCFEKYIKLNKI